MSVTAMKGDILGSTADLIAIPVNCIGIQGAGLAKAWAERDPDAAGRYRQLCHNEQPEPGSVAFLVGTRWALCATKDHWRDPSRVAWVRECLTVLRESEKWQTLAVPLLGAGLGGLSPAAVAQMTIGQFANDARRVEMWAR